MAISLDGYASMKVVYSTHPFEIELSGSRADYLSIAAMLVSGLNGAMELDLTGDPVPYDKCAKQLSIIHQAPSKVRIELSLTTETLSIYGGANSMLLLADNLKTFGEAEDASGHLHIEYFENHAYLDDASSPVVCVLE